MSGFSHLRTRLDGNDNFVSGGHSIIKTAGATLHAERMRHVPAWALDDDKIKELIDLRFPKCQTDPKQRQLAARMLGLIHLYYRAGFTKGVISHLLEMSEGAVDQMVFRINKAMKQPLKKIGRPRKPVSIP